MVWGIDDGAQDRNNETIANIMVAFGMISYGCGCVLFKICLLSALRLQR